MSNLVSNRRTRSPNEIEKNSIDLCVKHIRYQHIEIFIVFLILEIVIGYLIIVVFLDGSIGEILLMICTMGLIFFMISLFLLLEVYIIKKSKSKPYVVIIDKGDWDMIITTGKYQERYLTVNGEKIGLINPFMYNFFEEKEHKYIEYEYVEAIEAPLIFGYKNLFISINNRSLNKSDEDYLMKLKGIGVFSIISMPLFFVTFIFSIMTNFDDDLFNYILLGSFPILVRTVYVMIYNKRLRNKLKEKNIN